MDKTLKHSKRSIEMISKITDILNEGCSSEEFLNICYTVVKHFIIACYVDGGHTDEHIDRDLDRLGQKIFQFLARYREDQKIIKGQL